MLLFGKIGTDAFNYEQTVGKKPKAIFTPTSQNWLRNNNIKDLDGNGVDDYFET